jgi:hypothetical protein
MQWKRITLFVLAGIGALAIVIGLGGALYAYFFVSAKEFLIVQLRAEVPSPTTAFRLAHWVQETGSPFCQESLSVVPASVASPPSNDNLLKYRVVSVGCEAKLRFSWVNETRVRVELSASRGSGGTTGFFKPKDDSGSIAIEYEFGA